MAAFTHIVRVNGRWGTDMIEEGKKKKKGILGCVLLSAVVHRSCGRKSSENSSPILIPSVCTNRGLRVI